MRTLGDALGSLEEELCVDRESELAVFGQWLTGERFVPELLNVTGRGGTGKSALLRAFARVARRSGRVVLLVDSHDFPHTPEGLLGALGGASLDEVVERLNRARPLILFDTFEEMGELNRYLQESLLPRFATGVKIVVAGRLPLGLLWSGDPSWRRLIRSIELGCFSTEVGRTYPLSPRRG